MDENEGLLLIGTTAIILVVLLAAVLLIMLIYRKRTTEHRKEMELLNEKFNRELLQTELEIQRQTMQEIGREIHDNVGQKLTLSALHARQLEYEKSNDATGDRAKVIAEIIDESLSDLRSLSKSLTNDRIGQTGLLTLLEEECKKANATGVCEVIFSADAPQVNAPYQIKSIVVRIVQEFIQNSLRHSRCHRIRIDVSYTTHGLQIAGADDGRGFSSEISSTEAGIGINNMKKRAALIGAKLSLTSSPQSGTSMQLFIPEKEMTT